MVYLSESGLVKLRSISTGIETSRNDANCIYESYILGRQLAKPYNYYLPRGRYKMDVIYTDVVYLLVELFDGSKYFVSILDD